MSQQENYVAPVSDMGGPLHKQRGWMSRKQNRTMVLCIFAVMTVLFLVIMFVMSSSTSGFYKNVPPVTRGTLFYT